MCIEHYGTKTAFIPSIEGFVMVCFCQNETESCFYDVKTGAPIMIATFVKIH